MKTQETPAKWWQYLLTALVFVGLCLILWRSQAPNSSPTVSQQVPAGANAQEALQLKHE